MDFWTIFGAWLAAAMTLCVFSFLYRDNPLFKSAENLFTGVTLGYMLTILVKTTWMPKIWDPILKNGEFIAIVPVILGGLMLTRFFPKFSYLSRIGFAFIMGYTSGLTIPAAIVSRFMKQLEGSIQPLVLLKNGGLDFSWTGIQHSLSVLTGAVGLLAVLIYFFFSREHTGALKRISRVGIYFIMVYLGAAFGTTVMGRFSLLYGRIFDLYTFRTAQYNYATPVLLIAVVFFLTIHSLRQDKADAKAAADDAASD